MLYLLPYILPYATLREISMIRPPRRDTPCNGSHGYFTYTPFITHTPTLRDLTPPYLAAQLGILPPPHLLTSVALLAGNQAAPLYSAPNNLLPQTPAAQLASGSQTPHSTGLILSPASEPFPQRLVDKVKSGQFVEMRELLGDNIALLQQLEDIQGFPVATLGAARPRLREVTSLPSWIYCFLGYIAILTPDPITRSQLAYARLIIREALRHGGQGWRDYDRAFRQQRAADHTLPWNTLLPGLQAATILGQGRGQGSTLCTLCRGVDHVRSQCALLYLQPTPSGTTAPTSAAGTRRNICMSWNKGACVFPSSCTYRHVCATCLQQHKAKDCPRTPDSSIYKRPSQRPLVNPTQ